MQNTSNGVINDELQNSPQEGFISENSTTNKNLKNQERKI